MLGPFTPYAARELILRLRWGSPFFAHGRGKLKNPAGFAAFLRQIHVPAPLFNAWLVAAARDRGGGALILGIATRILALGIRSIWEWPSRPCVSKGPFRFSVPGRGWELRVPASRVAVALLFTGAGRFALDSFSDCEEATLPLLRDRINSWSSRSVSQGPTVEPGRVDVLHSPFWGRPSPECRRPRWPAAPARASSSD